MKTRKTGALSLLLAVLMLCLTVFPASAAESAESAAAATIQLMKTEGTVSVTNASERSITARNNMRLYSGYHVGTKEKSYAWINLDDTKLTKLDAVSEVEVRKSGKKLEMLLSSGNLYFNVTSPLESDETLNIRTSTLAVGIRGTCGWVKVLDGWTTEIYLLEGTVEVSVMDPVTGQVKTAALHGGDKAVAAVYPQDREGDKCDIIQERFEVGDIDGFVLAELVQDPGLCGDIYEDSGLDVLAPMGVLESVRRQLEEIREELRDIRERLESGDLPVEDAQRQLDELRERMEDVKDRLEELGPQDDVQRRLDEAQEHLEQAQEALESGVTQDALDRLDDAREDLEGARQAQAGNARQQGQETAQKRLEQDQQEMQDRLDRIEGDLAGQENNISTDPVWGPEGSAPAAPGGSNTAGGPTAPTQRTVTLTMPQTAAEVQRYLNDSGVDGVILRAGSDPAQNTLDVDIAMTVPSGKTLALGQGVSADIQSGDSLTVNGTMTGTGTLTNNGALTVNSSNTLDVRLIINNGALTNTTRGRIVTEELRTSGTLTNAGRIEGPVIASGGTFTMNGGEAVSSGSAATVTAQAGASLLLNGGTITNSGSGCVLSAAKADVTFGGTVLRAKRSDLFTGPGGAWMPEGFNAVFRGDEYYYLSPDNSNNPDNPDGPNAPKDPDDILGRLGSAQGGETVGLDDDYTGGSATDVEIANGTADEPVILDLNGHTLTMTGNFLVSGALKIIDSSADGDGPGTGKLVVNGTVRAENTGHLILDSGTIEGGGRYITCVSAVSGADFTMNGGAIRGLGSNTQVVYIGGGSAFVMWDGTISGNDVSYAVTVSGSAFTMHDGTINGMGGRAVNCIGSTFTMNSGSVTSSNSFATVYVSGGGSVTQNSGTITNSGTGQVQYEEN